MAAKGIDWNAQKFETKVEASGVPITFEKEGDSFVGIYVGTRDIEFEDPKEGTRTFKQHQFRDQDDKPRVLNGGYKLNEGFADIAEGSIVRITFVGTVPITGQPSPMKDYSIEVAAS